MKRCLFIFLLIIGFVKLCYAQPVSYIISRINRLKLDSLVLYGESTEKSESVATKHAIEELKDSFEECKKSHGGVYFDSTKISILKHPRGNNVRVFVYMYRDSLSAKSHTSAIDAEFWEKKLVTIKNWYDFLKFASTDPYRLQFNFGRVDLNTDNDVIKNSYIFVIKDVDKSIEDIYSPCGENNLRKSLKLRTKVQSISFKPGNEVYWLAIK